jgi:hypothetical protein
MKHADARRRENIPEACPADAAIGKRAFAAPLRRGQDKRRVCECLGEIYRDERTTEERIA